jgi:molecular chaperone GrpE (heat shock protein)
MKLNSSKFPNFEYEKGDWIMEKISNGQQTIWFDVEEELTEDEQAMEIVAEMLDDSDALVETARDYLKKALADWKNKYHRTVKFFLNFHKKHMEKEARAALLPVEDLSKLSLTDMIDYLKMKRFGSYVDSDTKQQAFIMDLSLNPAVTDELLVIHFNLERQVTRVAHES